jgi:crossover junction endonuclease MUS81
MFSFSSLILPFLFPPSRVSSSSTITFSKHKQGKPLTILPSHILTPTTHLPLLTRLRKEQPHLSYHLTYSTFSSLSSKSETLSLRDVFLKMLMCMHGITGEKALAIQRVWKTPKEFVAAFESCGSDEDAKKSLLESRVGGPVRTRKISRMLSAKVAEVWADVHLGP